MSESKKRSSSDLVDCEKASKGVWLVKVPRYLSGIWEKNAGSDVGWLKQVGEDEVNFISNTTTATESAPKPKPTTAIHINVPGSSTSMVNGRANLRKVPDLSQLKPVGPPAKEITIPKEHRFKFTRLDQSLGILLEDKSMLKDEAELKSGKITVEGRVVKRAEIQPSATKEYMMMKETMIRTASKPTSMTKKVDRTFNAFKPRAIQQELLQKQKAKKEMGIKSVRQDQGVVTDMIFKAFEKHEFYRLVDLAKVTGQPPNYESENMRINLSVERQTALGRICKITEWGTFPGSVDIKTPAYLTYTRVGHIPNITWDIYEKELKNLKQTQVFQLTLGSFFDSMEVINGIGMKDFCAMPKDSILHLTHHDSLKKVPANANTTKSMALWAKAGRRSIDPAIYKKLVKACQVHSFVGLNDFDTPSDAKKKRLGKSLFRTTEWNNEMFGIKSLDGHLDGLKMKQENDIDEAPFIPLGGGFSKEYRMLTVNQTKTAPYATSFAVDLWHVSQGNVDGKEEFDLEVVKDLIGDVLMVLPPEAPRLVEGSFDPSQIWNLVKLGVDLFDSSYAIMLADKGQAFRIGDNYWKTGEFTIMDLKNEEFKEDMDLLYSGCECHTCKTFKRAYIKHLLDTKELLAPVLLTIHNMTEFDRMFEKMDDVKLDRRHDWVGPPDRVSKIRPIKLRRVDNETTEEANYRKAREELTEWNSAFWTAHNELFEKKKAEFVKMKKQKLGKLEQVSAADMSVFYKQFLNERAQDLSSYNNEWYRRNFSLIFPAIKVNWIRFCRLLKR